MTFEKTTLVAKKEFSKLRAPPRINLTTRIRSKTARKDFLTHVIPALPEK